MSSPVNDPTSAQGKHTLFTVGTLTYSKHALWMLFFWLMWNEFTITLLEKVPHLTTFLLREYGATFEEMNWFGAVGGILGMWINPFFSTWSDRTRTKWGRRRPFLLFSVPVFTLGLIAIPFMPDLYYFLLRFESIATVLNSIPMKGEVLFIGMARFFDSMFNGVVLAIFSYYYWDVVPAMVLGRFNALAKNVTFLAGIIWSFWIFGIADTNMKEVYVIVSLTCCTIYMVTIFMVKEGDYPPPEPYKGNFIDPIKCYFKDCFSKPYYLWIFVGTLVYQLGNQGGGFQTFYLREDLHMTFKEIGWGEGWGSSVSFIFGMTLGYGAGSLIDRLKPIRVIPYILLVWSLACVFFYFYVVDKNTFMISRCIISIINFAFAVAIGAATVQFFPREKLGQFCSAQAVFYQTIINIVSPLIGKFFDKINYNRFGFIWSAIFYFLAAIVAVKVYYNWKRKTQEDALADPIGQLPTA